MNRPASPGLHQPAFSSQPSVMIVKLANFYDFRSSRDVTRYKTRLQDGLLLTGSGAVAGGVDGEI